ncbi:ABC transporter ATP-binding protein [Paenibacillus psychroresistens]|uniref:ABC transporter ATP-binding protein n=2 Tax=Paenibacillus psychroresistens TaxID=1778678 RepID=A0A6B8RFR1_9BACL|nr:ABC transporter ATP-binding protein [Paenibacillus psychroresistens]QGQ95301.1 ABC transporter ATP-binding protein [Paenibacillus psychroresistens]
MTTPIVQIRHLTKRLGNKTIIDNLSFEVPRGEIFGFLGPNGAGKTTTIRMMVGLMSISEGEVLINGHSIKHEFEAAIAQIGAIVENPEMYKYLTGYQNLLHFARMSPNVSKERINEVIKLVALGNRIHDKVKTYSLGMRQRLGVAQALLHKPALLILDEPTNGLDPAGIRELRDYLKKLTQEDNISVIVSSHLLSEMELLCDRVAIIQHGKLTDVRLVKDYLNESELVKVIFKVDQQEAALQIIKTRTNFSANAIHSQIELSLNYDQIAEVNAIWVQNGIKVYSIQSIVPTLEDTFLQMTGSDPIA